jgi:hypothetical protein
MIFIVNCRIVGNVISIEGVEGEQCLIQAYREVDDFEE